MLDGRINGATVNAGRASYDHAFVRSLGNLMPRRAEQCVAHFTSDLLPRHDLKSVFGIYGMLLTVTLSEVQTSRH